MKDDLTSGDSYYVKEIKTLKVAKAISTGEGSAEARNRINQLVREIDKCIALLNN